MSGPKLRPEDPSYVERLAEVFPFQNYVEGAEHRGITYFQLHRIIAYALQNCSAWRDLSNMSRTGGQTLSRDIMNLYHINDWLILPATRESDCSCMELLAGHWQNPDWFVSHWWGELVADFLDCVHAYIETRNLKAEASFWVCAYANRQHSLEDASDITADPHDSSFFKAMKLSRGMLLILDGKAGTLFTRIWCAFEVSMAILYLHKPIDILGFHDGEIGVLTSGLTSHEEALESKNPGLGWRGKATRESGFPVDVVKTGLSVCLEKTDASFAIDRVRILNCIAERESLEEKPLAYHANYSKVNVQLRAHFAAAIWYHAIESESINVEDLAEALVADEWRTSLVMNLGFSSKMDDNHLAVLSQGIAQQLHSLELHFWMCQSISNKGLEALSKVLPADLESLILNFQMCVNITSFGITSLGRALESMKHLKVLRLNFEMDKDILSIHGLTEGIANLPDLLVLDLNLGGLDQLSNKEVAGITKVFPRQLTTLSLGLQQCIRLDNISVVAIAHRLPVGLHILNLNFKGVDQITNAAVESLAQHMPPNLLALHINFEDCALISEAGIIPLVRALPETLYGGKLNMQGTALSADKQKVCRRLDRMRQWKAPVKPRGDSLLHRATHEHTAEQPLFLRSINHIVMAEAEKKSKAHSGTRSPFRGEPLGASVHSGQRTGSKSFTGLPRPIGDISSETIDPRPRSSQERRRRKDPTDPFDPPQEKALHGTLHRYFHDRTSTHGWSADSGARTTLKQQWRRPVQAPASVYWSTHPEAMFMKPRVLFQGLSEPVWR